MTTANGKSAKAWLTYSWDDDLNAIDFIAQALEEAGITVRLDRWDIRAGRRLWEQIEDFIQDPSTSDAWLLYATQASLMSEACKEEYAYALQRALGTRGGAFPLIGLSPSRVNDELIPAGRKTRLYASLTDPDWKERIVAGIEGRDPSIVRRKQNPYEIWLHKIDDPATPIRFASELRPRAGVWAPFFAAVPTEEHKHVHPSIAHGPRGLTPYGYGSVLFDSGSGISPTDPEW